MATTRVYDRQQYTGFLAFHKAQNHELELCLHDSYIDEDKDWMDLWGSENVDVYKYETKYVIATSDNEEISRGPRGNFHPGYREYRRRF